MYKSISLLIVVSGWLFVFQIGCSSGGSGANPGPGARAATTGQGKKGGRSATGGQGKKEDSLTVNTTEVKKREVSRVFEVVGSLLPSEEVTVSSEIDGKVERISVDIGDKVQKGQPLLKISAEELQYQLDGQLATLHQALAKLGLSEEDSVLRSETEVPEVRKAAADRFEAEQNYLRAKELYEETLIPRQQLDTAEARYNSSNATYEATLQQVQITKAAIEQYRAGVQLARKKLQDTEIRAPFSGWVKQRLVAPGQYLRVQAPVFTIVDNNPLKFTAQVPERMASWVKVGSGVQLRIEAYPDRTFSGKVSRVSPASSLQTRSFSIEALVDNSNEILKSGLFAKASIATDKKDTIKTVPSAAITYKYGVYKLFVIQDHKALSREIRVGDTIGDEVEIIEGANEKEIIALSNLDSLNDGMEVQTAQAR